MFAKDRVGEMPVRGKFITFEGGEGGGKTTQARMLADALRARGIEVRQTREPGGTPWAERMRSALLTEKGRALEPVEQAIMFAAARADHVDHLIRPALAEGCFVVCDRFADSTEAYQGALGTEPAVVDLLKRIAVGRTLPDLTFVLDLPPAEGLARAAERDTLDPFEADTLAVHEARRAVFLEIAAREPERCVIVDARENPATIAAAIFDVVRERLLAPTAA